jgi:hypothetical protein
VDPVGLVKLLAAAIIAAVRRVRRRNQRPGKHRRPDHHAD